jgi:pimeloyl-ACP methyl ester carboxylesterase
VIVGRAYGHFVARMTAADHPHLVRGVVVAAGAARSHPGSLSALVTTAADPSRPECDHHGDPRGQPLAASRAAQVVDAIATWARRLPG